jgi:predicted acetyltransferase
MKLVKPSIEWKEAHQDYVNEWGKDRIVPSSMDLRKYDSYETFLQELANDEHGVDGWVANSNYYLIDKTNRLVAMVNIRHELNDLLHKVGGHIGYGVRPSERQKGYASIILAEALKKCHELNILKVLVTCDEDNIGSTKTILNNGGVEDDSIVMEDGIVKRRFWIKLD